MSFDLLATLLLVAAPSAQAPPPKEAPRFAAEATLVTVDAVVLDADGRPVRGLVAGDFAVLEDGLAQAVTSFEAIDVAVAPAEDEPERPVVSTNMAPAQEAGRTFAVVWDGVHISPQGEALAKGAVARFLGQGVREGDSVCLVSTAGTTWWTARGVRGRDTLLRLLDGLRGERVSALPPNAFISDFEAVRIVEYGDAVLAGAVWRRLIQAGVTFDPDEVTVALVGVPRAGDQQAPSTRERAWLRHHAEVEGLAGQLYAVVQNRRRASLGTLERVIDSLTTRGGRKSVLLVSEGFVADGNTPRFREVIDAARRANAAVYFIDVRGLSASVEDVVSGVGQAMGRDAQEGAALQRVRTSLDDESSGADLVADASGGWTVKNTNDLTRGFRLLERESAAYYLLGYRPTDERRDGRWRAIRVHVGRPGLTVRARKGYYAIGPGAELPAGKKGRKQAARSLVQRAVDAPFDVSGLPLRVSTYVLDERKRGAAGVVVATEVGVRDLAFERRKGRLEARLEVTLVVLDLESGARFPLDETVDMRLTETSHEAYRRSGYPLLRMFTLRPGTYQVRVVVLDEGSRRLGSVAHEFEVPALEGWRVSTPILSDVLDDSTAEGAVPQPVPLARRTFPAGGILYCLFAVYGAAVDPASKRPAVASGFSLQTAGGREVRRGDEAAIRPDREGHLVRLVGIPLEGLAAGDYSLLLTFEDRVAGTRHERREPLRVAP